jgi:hypothetical protein
MEINGENYRVFYDQSTAHMTLEGSLRLQGVNEYEPIVQILDEMAAHAQPTLTLNLQALEFLNSSGINILSRFVIKLRKQGDHHLIIQGNKQFSWQTKSLKNLERLMPGLMLELE